jgi:hypothetical protein
MEKGTGVYRILRGNLKERDHSKKPKRRWEDNIKRDLQEVDCGCINWIELAQDTERWWGPENAVMKLRVPRNAGNFLTSSKPVSFSRWTLIR